MTAKMKLTVNLPEETLKGLDKARGDTPRSVFIQRAVEKYLASLIKKAKK